MRCDTAPQWLLLARELQCTKRSFLVRLSLVSTLDVYGLCESFECRLCLIDARVLRLPQPPTTRAERTIFAFVCALIRVYSTLLPPSGRYQLQRTAIELFFAGGKSYFFDLGTSLGPRSHYPSTAVASRSSLTMNLL